jgi:RNA polymerase sigma-70 factor (ECF subfamily)
LTGHPTDSELIAASWTDPQQFAQIFQRHLTAIYAFTVRAVGPSQGPDLAAETFVRALAIRRRFDTEMYSNARPWLLGIAANLIAGHLRSRAREYRAVGRLSSVAEPAFDEEAVNRVQAESIAPALRRALGSLRQEEVEVVSLFALEGLSYKEIAVALGIAEGTVRSRLSRARTRLRNLLADPGEIGPT